MWLKASLQNRPVIQKGQGNKAVDVANLSVMVSVAQLVEPRIVIPVVAGSILVAHPTFSTMPRSEGDPICTA